MAAKPQSSFGVAPEGDERKQFERYITAHRPKPGGLHVNYNSCWTAPSPFFKESDILELMDEFEQKLYQPYGVSLDTFCLDLGWSEPRSVWEIKKDLFPEGFSRIQSAAGKMGADLGLWISPSACYRSCSTRTGPGPMWKRSRHRCGASRKCRCVASAGNAMRRRFAPGWLTWCSAMTFGKQSPAKLVDLDVAEAKTIELVVGHGDDGIMSDHADWGDAKLLR